MGVSRVQLINILKAATNQDQLTAWEKILIEKKLKLTNDMRDIIRVLKIDRSRKKISQSSVFEIADNYSNQIRELNNPLLWNAQIVAYYLLTQSMPDVKLKEFAFFYDKLITCPPVDGTNASQLMFEMIENGIIDSGYINEKLHEQRTPTKDISCLIKVESSTFNYEKMKKFYYSLRKASLIDHTIEYKTFKNYFSYCSTQVPTQKLPPIIWKGEKGEFRYLIYEMGKRNILIDRKEKYKETASCFSDENGIIFDAKIMNNRNPREKRKIDKVLDSLS